MGAGIFNSLQWHPDTVNFTSGDSVTSTVNSVCQRWNEQVKLDKKGLSLYNKRNLPICALLDDYDNKREPLLNHLSDQIQNLLNDEFRRFTRRYERKTISLGVGKAAEEILDELLHSDPDSGKVTQKRVRDRHRGRVDADRLLFSFWRGR